LKLQNRISIFSWCLLIGTFAAAAHSIDFQSRVVCPFPFDTLFKSLSQSKVYARFQIFEEISIPIMKNFLEPGTQVVI